MHRLESEVVEVSGTTIRMEDKERRWEEAVELGVKEFFGLRYA